MSFGKTYVRMRLVNSAASGRFGIGRNTPAEVKLSRCTVNDCTLVATSELAVLGGKSVSRIGLTSGPSRVNRLMPEQVQHILKFFFPSFYRLKEKKIRLLDLQEVQVGYDG